MAHEPNPFESEIFQHYRIQEKAKTINNAIKILIEHNYIVIDLEGNFIKKD
jgi:hypothetical protein|tara:strand:+ start:152 stop:304 length:153 start_codon:yes stop_codon:yes gene_type:complete